MSPRRAPRREPDPDLDRLLVAWAARVQVDGRRAEAIRMTVVHSGSGGQAPLDQRWWQELQGSVAALIVQVTAMPAAAAAALEPPAPVWNR